MNVRPMGVGNPMVTGPGASQMSMSSAMYQQQQQQQQMMVNQQQQQMMQQQQCMNMPSVGQYVNQTNPYSAGNQQSIGWAGPANQNMMPQGTASQMTAIAAGAQMQQQMQPRITNQSGLFCFV